jgi:hypothetical protein
MCSRNILIFFYFLICWFNFSLLICSAFKIYKKLSNSVHTHTHTTNELRFVEYVVRLLQYRQAENRHAKMRQSRKEEIVSILPSSVQVSRRSDNQGFSESMCSIFNIFLRKVESSQRMNRFQLIICQTGCTTSYSSDKMLQTLLLSSCGNQQGFFHFQIIKP